MSIASSRSAHSTSPADYLRAFASRRQCWVVLARNLIPVAGVYIFDWSIALTTFNYWFDGVTAMAAILAAAITRATIEGRRAYPTTGMLRLVVIGVVLWIIVFGLSGIPYWFLLDSAKGVLQLPVIAAEVEQSPALWLTFGALALSQFWRAFDSYLKIPADKLKDRWPVDFFALIARAAAMEAIANFGFGMAMVPLMALLLTYIEVSPELQATMLENYRAKQRI
jgi:hypothetical protein